MPTNQNDLEARVTALEHQMRSFASDAAAARVLAGAADRDVSAMQGELNANRKVLNALRETQLEQMAVLREHGGRLDSLEAKVDRLDTKVDGLDTKVDGLDTKVDGLDTKVDGLETKVDGLETKMDDRFAAVEEQLTTVIALVKGREPGSP